MFAGAKPQGVPVLMTRHDRIRRSPGRRRPDHPLQIRLHGL
jgi:hypothetical protein